MSPASSDPAKPPQTQDALEIEAEHAFHKHVVPSYLGGRGRRTVSMRAVSPKLERSCLKNKHKGWGCGSSGQKLMS
jgi:hypothetical protein